MGKLDLEELQLLVGPLKKKLGIRQKKSSQWSCKLHVEQKVQKSPDVKKVKLQKHSKMPSRRILKADLLFLP